MDRTDNKPDLPVWNLVFSDRPPYTLDRTVFYRHANAAPLVAIRGVHFVWRHGLYAMAIFYVQFKAESKRENPEDLVFDGPRHSPAASLALALAQAEKKEEEKRIGWPKNVSGNWRSLSPDSGLADSGLPLLTTLIEHHHRDKGSPKETFICIPLVAMLPPENVRIYVGELAYKQGRELTSFEELDAVADDLCRNWMGAQNYSSRVECEILEARFHCIRIGKIWEVRRFPRPFRVSIPVGADKASTLLTAIARWRGE